jgi:hypothetical protein
MMVNSTNEDMGCPPEGHVGEVGLGVLEQQQVVALGEERALASGEEHEHLREASPAGLAHDGSEGNCVVAVYIELHRALHRAQEKYGGHRQVRREWALINTSNMCQYSAFKMHRGPRS